MKRATPAVEKVDLGHVNSVTAIPVTDAMFEIIDELLTGDSQFLDNSLEGWSTGSEVVVRFLAILELYKQGHIDLEQKEWFGDITLTWTGNEEELLVLVAVSLMTLLMTIQCLRGSGSTTRKRRFTNGLRCNQPRVPRP